jgi:hypothetical protein
MDRPGDPVPGATEGITRLEDMPLAHLERPGRNDYRRQCPLCGRSAPRRDEGGRILHDLGHARTGRPIDIAIPYSKPRCIDGRQRFNADMSDLALPGRHQPHRVQQRGLRPVVEDGLP